MEMLKFWDFFFLFTIQVTLWLLSERYKHQLETIQNELKTNVRISSVQSLSRVRLFATPWTAACQASLSFTISGIFINMSIESMMPSRHLVLCHTLLLLPSIFASIRVFSNESALHTRWPNYWSFRFRISPSSKYSGLISFGIDWLDLLAVHRTLKSLLQHHSSKASNPVPRLKLCGS